MSMSIGPFPKISTNLSEKKKSRISLSSSSLSSHNKRIDAALDSLLLPVDKETPRKPNTAPPIDDVNSQGGSPRLLHAQSKAKTANVRFRTEMLAAKINGDEQQGAVSSPANEIPSTEALVSQRDNTNLNVNSAAKDDRDISPKRSPLTSSRRIMGGVAPGTAGTSFSTPRSQYGSKGYHEQEPRPEWARPWKDKPPPTVDRLIAKLTTNLDDLNKHVIDAESAVSALQAKIAQRIEEEERILKETENDGL